MQYLIPPTRSSPYPSADVQPSWSEQGTDAPSSLLLDFVYGASVIKHWAGSDAMLMLEEPCQFYQNVLTQPISTTLPEGTNINEPDDLAGPSHAPPRTQPHHREQQRPKERELSDAMDVVSQLSLFVRGYPLEMTWAEVQKKQEEEVEHHHHEVGKEKVQQWLQTTKMDVSCYGHLTRL